MSSLKIEDIIFDDEFDLKTGSFKPLIYVRGIYFIFNEKEELLYIGQTKNVYSRLFCHLRSNTNNIVLPNNCKVKVLRIRNKRERQEKEKYYISNLLPSLNYSYTNGLSERCISFGDEVVIVEKPPVIKDDKVCLNIKIKKDIYDKVVEIAKEEVRTTRNQIIYFIAEGISQFRR